MEHGRVVGLIESAETWGDSAYALIAVNLEIENADDQCVTGFGAVDEEWTRERIVDLDQREGVTGFFNGVAETIERVGFEDVADVKMRNGWGGGVDVLYGVDRSVIADRLGAGLLCVHERGETRSGKDQNRRRDKSFHFHAP